MILQASILKWNLTFILECSNMLAISKFILSFLKKKKNIKPLRFIKTHF